VVKFLFIIFSAVLVLVYIVAENHNDLSFELVEIVSENGWPFSRYIVHLASVDSE